MWLVLWYLRDLMGASIMQFLKYLALNVAYREAPTEQSWVTRELHISYRFQSRGLRKAFYRCCLQYRLGIMLPTSFLDFKSYRLVISHAFISQTTNQQQKEWLQDSHKFTDNTKCISAEESHFWGERWGKTQLVKGTTNNLWLTSHGEMLRCLKAPSTCVDVQTGTLT